MGRPSRNRNATGSQTMHSFEIPPNLVTGSSNTRLCRNSLTTRRQLDYRSNVSGSRPLARVAGRTGIRPSTTAISGNSSTGCRDRPRHMRMSRRGTGESRCSRRQILPIGDVSATGNHRTRFLSHEIECTHWTTPSQLRHRRGSEVVASASATVQVPGIRVRWRKGHSSEEVRSR